MGRKESVKVLMVRAAARNCGDARRTDILIMNEAGEFIWRSDAILRSNEIRRGHHSPARGSRATSDTSCQQYKASMAIVHCWHSRLLIR